MVAIHNKSGERVHLRALLDSGSQVSFITEAKAKALILKVQKTPSTIITLGASSSQKTCGVLPATIAGSIDVNRRSIDIFGPFAIQFSVEASQVSGVCQTIYTTHS